MFDNKVHAALGECAARTERSKAAVIRAAIVAYHAMVVGALPTCANGQQCLCPQMHSRLPPSAPVQAPTTGLLPPPETDALRRSSLPSPKPTEPVAP